MISEIELWIIVIITFFVAGWFSVKAMMATDPNERIKLSLYGLAFMILGYLGNHYIPVYNHWFGF